MSIDENIKMLRDRLSRAAEKAGRDTKDITLIAVSKTKPNEMIREALDCGMVDFGENKPQELASKYSAFEGEDIRWHQIGTLQKNKVRHIVGKASLIHSVDSLSLAIEIDKRAKAIDIVQDILIQVNISGEESKSGVTPDELPALCREISELKGVSLKGLMTISVRDYSYDENKALFEKLYKLSKEIESLNINRVKMDELSMGMTNDFEAAIEAGATLIRVGTAIFGERSYNI